MLPMEEIINDWREQKVSALLEKARCCLATFCNVPVIDIEIVGVIKFDENYLGDAEDSVDCDMTFVYYNRMSGLEGAILSWSYETGEFCRTVQTECSFFNHPTNIYYRSGGWRDLTCKEMETQILIYLADMLDIAPKHIDINGLVHQMEGVFEYESISEEISRIQVFYTRDRNQPQSVVLEWCYAFDEFWSHY